MKKIVCWLLLCATFSMAAAQAPAKAQDFSSYASGMNGRLSEASQKKDYRRLVTLLSEWLAEYSQQVPDTQRSYRSYLPNIYYNLACYQALAGQESEAVKSFQKAVDAGYNNYAHAKKDTDLDGLRSNAHFRSAMLDLQQKGDYSYLLRQSGKYSPNAYPTPPAFTYQSSLSPELVAFRQKFNLDSISGNGDEISRIKNLLYWAHNVVRHDGNSSNPPSRNAVDLIEVCRKENRGVNCRMMATILKDAYQAMGFEARAVTCLPKDTSDFDCHVINIVWSKTLDKWVWMDPTFNAYVSDERGNLLGIEEVRARLIRNQPLVLNEDANWNNKVRQTRESYLEQYMAKNLYWLQCPVKSEWDLETAREGKPEVEYVSLYPGGFSTISGSAKLQRRSNVYYATEHAAYFWQRPSSEAKGVGEK